MKKLFLTAVLASLFLLEQPLSGADTNSVKFELGNLIGKIQAKVNERKRTEEDLADEIKQFDALYEKHKGEKTQDVAEILLAKLNLYLHVFKAPGKAVDIAKEIKHSFPDLVLNGNTDKAIQDLEAQAEAKKLGANLEVGAQFPDFNENDLNGKPLSVANYKGKVVLIDFWATWCPPCRMELPYVIKAYEKYHGKGFEIIGVSLDSDKNALQNLIKVKDMKWPQYQAAEGFRNKLVQKYGVDGIPAIYLIDGTGKIIGKGAHGEGMTGEDLDAAIGKALAKK